MDVDISELQGLFQALELFVALQHEPVARPVQRLRIFTDSERTVRLFANARHVLPSGQAILHDSIDIIKALSLHKVRTSIHWLPSHKDIPCSDKVNIVAQYATRAEQYDGTCEKAAPPTYHVTAYLAPLRRHMKLKFKELAQMRWAQANIGRELYKILPT